MSFSNNFDAFVPNSANGNPGTEDENNPNSIAELISTSSERFPSDGAPLRLSFRQWVLRKAFATKRMRISLGILFLVCATLGAISFTWSTKDHSNVTKEDLILPYKNRYTLFRTHLGKHSPPWVFVLSNSPQARAFHWLVFQDKTLQTDPVDESRLVQRYAIMTLFYACAGHEWKGVFTSFPRLDKQTDVNECDFPGIKCDDDGLIVSFEPVQSRVTGKLPDEIGLLTRLTRLNLASNDLIGRLPAALFEGLTSLTRLNLEANDFSSTLPSQIGNLTQLEYLNLSSNRLVGGLPLSLTKLSNLESLYLARNTFTGGFFDTWNGWPNLTILDMEQTGLTGTIPENISESKYIEQLWVSHDMTGSIPRSLFDLPNLKDLKLEGKGFTGTFFHEIGKLTNLVSLCLSQTVIGGTIPTAISLLTNLEKLVLVDTKISGTIPTEIGQLSRLQDIYIVSSSEMSGTIPSEMGALSLLKVLVLDNTPLRGEIPKEICASSTQIVYPCTVVCQCCTSPCSK